MNKNRWGFALAVLMVASLACSVFSGGGQKTPATPAGTNGTGSTSGEVVASTDTPAPDGNGSGKYDTEFPLPDNVSNFTDMGNGSINFQTKMSIKDVVAFYRQAFAKAGYKERQINTSITDTTLSLVFDGHASGKAIVVQGVDLGSGATNVNIRFDKV